MENWGVWKCVPYLQKKKKQEKQKGVVYPEFLNGTEQAAVKALSHSSTQGYKQFKAEVLSME